jgi:glycosyltransferase involved in cell wall biosynthesis
VPVAAAAGRLLGRRLEPDLVHGLFLSGHGWTAHSLRVRPLVLSALGSDIRDLVTTDGVPPVERAVEAYRVRRTRAAVAAADVVLADSEAIARAVRERVPGTETRIVRFGVELRRRPRADGAGWRRRLEIDEDAFVLLSTRLVRPLYNIDTIVRALPAIRARLPKAVLVLKEIPRFSDSDYHRQCLDLSGQLGVRDAVRTVGEVSRDELLELQAAADVYLSVPDSDGTAVSVLEAMAAGVAVVATDAPGIDPVILSHDETALLVRPRDSDGLAAAVVSLGADEMRRRRIAVRGAEVVRRHGDFDRELDRAMLLYEELVRTRRSN